VGEHALQGCLVLGEHEGGHPTPKRLRRSQGHSLNLSASSSLALWSSASRLTSMRWRRSLTVFSRAETRSSLFSLILSSLFLTAMLVTPTSPDRDLRVDLPSIRS